MALYVYALLGTLPLDDPGHGLVGEPLVVLPSNNVFAAVGSMEAPPPIERDTLLQHDAIVRRLATQVEAILPVRFGTLLSSERELHEGLADRREALGRALELVRGREQVTLRVFRHGAPAEDPPLQEPEAGPHDGPGTTFLLARQAAHRRARTVPELDALRPALTPLVMAERVERHDRGALVATVFHLIRRGTAPAYIEHVTTATALPEGIRLAVTGPWPPYAFAPELLA